MRLQVKGRTVDVTDAMATYAERKLGKLSRHLSDGSRCELELATEHNPSISDRQIAEATVWTKGPTLRAREASRDMKASIDQLTEKLLRQVTDYREKRTRPYARHRQDGGIAQMPQVADEGQPPIVKTKQFPVKPMTPEEAVLQLELIGHDFFVFRNAETNDVNVVYRRQSGGYGLIEPS